MEDEPPKDSPEGAEIAPGDVLASAEAKQAAGKPLTKEEQMALYEKALKEDDWGHQPC